MLKMGRTVPSSEDLDWIKRREGGEPQHSPLSSYCECDAITCLTSLMPRLPHSDRLHPQTVNQSKPSLPLSGPQDQQLIQPLFLVPPEVLILRGFLSKFPPSKTTNSQILNEVNRSLRSVSLTLVWDAKLQLRVWSPSLTLPQSNSSPRHWGITSLHIHSHPRHCPRPSICRQSPRGCTLSLRSWGHSSAFSVSPAPTALLSVQNNRA